MAISAVIFLENCRAKILLETITEFNKIRFGHHRVYSLMRRIHKRQCITAV